MLIKFWESLKRIWDGNACPTSGSWAQSLAPRLPLRGKWRAEAFNKQEEERLKAILLFLHEKLLLVSIKRKWKDIPVWTSVRLGNQGDGPLQYGYSSNRAQQGYST